MTAKQPTTPYPLRLPLPLRRTLQAMAEANRRSLAGEIVFRLEAAVRDQQAAESKPAP